MITIKKEKAFENADFLNEKSSSTTIFLESLEILKMNEKNCKRKIAFISLEFIIAIIMSLQTETILLTKDVLIVIITITIALMAIVFTGYVFFQALINDTLLLTLMSIDINSEGNLYNTNKYFAKVFTFQIFSLVLSLVFVILMIILPNEWCISGNNIFNEIVATIGILAILYINFEGIWEMKSFIFNVFQLFNLHTYSRLIEIKKADK